jgi:hypothetical protein
MSEVFLLEEDKNGRRLLTPSCPISKAICELMYRKCIPPKAVRVLKKNGVKVNIKTIE